MPEMDFNLIAFLLCSFALQCQIGRVVGERKDLKVIESTFVSERQAFLRTGVESPTYKSLVERYRKNRRNDDQLKNNFMSPEMESEDCVLCRIIGGCTLEVLREPNATAATLQNEALSLCLLLNLQTEEVCSNLINLFLPATYHILQNRTDLTSETICGVIYQNGLCKYDNPQFNFTINVSPGGSPITKSKGVSPGGSKNNLKIVHLSDIHYNPRYVAGHRADCSEPSCCRIDNEKAPRDSLDVAAGAWGHYQNCDSPWSVVEDVLDEIKARHPDVDAIYFTGDVVDHSVWNTSVADNKATIRKVYEAMNERFTHTPIFSVLGNHEPSPVNLFAPSYIDREDLSTHWLYQLQLSYMQSLTHDAGLDAIQEDGYYTALVRPGLRVIVLNNNVGQVYNFWVLYDPEYLTRQLQWLNDVLFFAEQDNEKVHILYHIPNGDSGTFKVWAREFRRLVERYWDTISAQFNGHTHNNEFHIFYSMNNSDYAINSAFNAGSTTTYTDVNPNYNVYYVDTNNYEINNFFSYYYNLTEANLEPADRPVWRTLLDSNDICMTNWSPAGLDNLAHRLARNHSELFEYFEFKVKRGDRALDIGCDEDCLRGHLCQMVTTQFDDPEKCTAMTEIYLTAAIDSNPMFDPSFK